MAYDDERRGGGRIAPNAMAPKGEHLAYAATKRDMTTSSTHKTYPARLYEEGKCPLQYRSMNHNCHLASLQMVEEAVGLDAWESIKTSSGGVIVSLKEMDYTWSAQVVHHLLTNQLVVDNIHELWSLIEGQPIRFSLFEFSEITGLNCEPLDINDKVEVEHKAFWQEMVSLLHMVQCYLSCGSCSLALGTGHLRREE